MEGQLAGVISLPVQVWGQNSGHQSWWQMTTCCAIPPAPQLQLLISVGNQRLSPPAGTVAASQPTPQTGSLSFQTGWQRQAQMQAVDHGVILLFLFLFFCAELWENNYRFFSCLTLMFQSVETHIPSPSLRCAALHLRALSVLFLLCSVSLLRCKMFSHHFSNKRGKSLLLLAVLKLYFCFMDKLLLCFLF